jgi:hypothetical protein
MRNGSSAPGRNTGIRIREIYGGAAISAVVRSNASPKPTLSARWGSTAAVRCGR